MDMKCSAFFFVNEDSCTNRTYNVLLMCTYIQIVYIKCKFFVGGVSIIHQTSLFVAASTVKNITAILTETSGLFFAGRYKKLPLQHNGQFRVFRLYNEELSNKQNFPA